MPDNQITSKLVFETDTASLNKAKKAYQSLGDDLDDFIALQEESARKQRQLNQEQADAIAFENNVRKQSYDAPKRGANAWDGAGVGLDKLETGINALSIMSGDIDVGNIIGLADGILDLNEGLKTIPSAFSNILSLVNPLTAGLAGIGIGLALLSASTAENAEKLQARLDANQRASDIVAAGGTTAEIQEQIRALERRRDADQKLLDQNKRAYEQYENQDPITGTFLKVFDQAEETLANTINEGSDKIYQYDESIRALTASMETAEVAANDYAQAILQQSELVKQAVLTEFEANERTAEQNRERLRQIEVQIQATEAQLAVLEEAETQSAETSAKIAELEAQLKALGQEAEITSRYTQQTAKDVQNANKEQADSEKKLAEERTRAIEDGVRQQQEALKQQAQALENYNNRLVDIALANADKEEDASRQLNDSLSDARRKLNADLQGLDEKARQDRQKFITDTQADEAKNARDHARNMQKILKDADRQREDLARNLDFAGLFDLENMVNQQLSDAQEEYDAERQERQLAYEKQLGDLKTQAGQERRERQKAYAEQLTDIRLQTERAKRDRQIAYDREIEAAKRQYERQLALLEEKLGRETGAYQQAVNGANKGAGVGSSKMGNISAPNPTIGNSPNTTIGGRIFSSTNNTANNTVSIHINGAQNPQAIGAQVRSEIRKVLGG